MHAGIITTGLDGARGHAAFWLMPADPAVLTVELKTSLLAPGKSERFLFRGSVVKAGRTLTFCDARAIGLPGDGGERAAATVAGTLMATFERRGVVQ